MGYIIASIIVTIAVAVWIKLSIFDLLAEKIGARKVEQLLFMQYPDSKQQIVSLLSDITSNRLSDSDIIDYFIKIKGFQFIDPKIRLGFWERKYLSTKPNVKLSYFEQAKFFEAFINFPHGQCIEKIGLEETSQLSSFPLTEATQKLIRNPSLIKNIAF